jgi:hypothetical protein
MMSFSSPNSLALLMRSPPSCHPLPSSPSSSSSLSSCSSNDSSCASTPSSNSNSPHQTEISIGNLQDGHNTARMATCFRYNREIQLLLTQIHSLPLSPSQELELWRSCCELINQDPNKFSNLHQEKYSKLKNIDPRSSFPLSLNLISLVVQQWLFS